MITTASTKNQAKDKTPNRHRGMARVTALVVPILVAMALMTGLASAQPVVNYQVTTDVSARSTPTAATTNVYGIPSGATFGVECQVIGQPVGPRGNTLYFLADYAGRQFYVPDTYTNSPHLAGQPPIAGVPMCPPAPAATPAAAPAPAPSTTTPAVWIGSPFHGTWPNTDGCAGATYPSEDCSLPSVHHIVYYNPSGGFLDDWAADLQSVSPGTAVVLYAAPQNTSLAITAQVETVGPACADGQPADGGYRVTVAFYNGSIRIGTVTYAHIQPTVSQGQWVNRWGTTLGTVGSYHVNDCWQGVHTHIEMSSQYHYACYNRGWAPGQSMNPTNFIGFIGGDYADSPRQPCP